MWQLNLNDWSTHCEATIKHVLEKNMRNFPIKCLMNYKYIPLHELACGFK